jgi:signal transduction histidine kinase
MTSTAITAADLRPLDLFDGLDGEALGMWAGAAQMRVLAPGDLLVEADVEPEGMICLLEGEVQTFARDGERYEPVSHQRAPTWIGAIATLTEAPIGVRMVATTPCRLAFIPASEFRTLTLAHPSVHRAIMHRVGPVMSRITALEQNRERLAALGTMAAGLAHELNNPASAAKRSAAQLAEALDVVTSTMGLFVRSGVERADALAIVELQEEAVRQAAQRTALDALDAADAEDAVGEALEDLAVPEAWRLAEPLAAAGIDRDWLAQVSSRAGEATPAAVAYMAATLTANGLVAELRESTARMSALVAAVKAYAYMDRGGLVDVDIHEGLETTLTVLHYKLKHTSIDVRRAYDRALPHLTVHGSELNQVWTNLLDNAIDALGERGTITVATLRDADCIRVDIGDDGPGIPADARPHVFEPFFTTKPVGHGTGLGLDTARRIVHERHRGTLTFDTGEGGTTFHVWLPLGGAQD